MLEAFHSCTGNDREEFEKRMARQLSPEEKARRADYVIQNDGTLTDLQEQVKKRTS